MAAWLVSSSADCYLQVFDLVVNGEDTLAISGGYLGSVDIDPSAQTSLLPATSIPAAMFASFDSAGQLLASTTWDAAGGPWATKLAAGNNGDYVYGPASSTTPLSPTPSISIAADVPGNAYLLELDATGAVVNASKFGGSGAYAFIIHNDIFTDDAGRVYVAGPLGGEEIDLDPDPATVAPWSSLSGDAFLLRLRPRTPADPNVLFADRFEVGEWNGLWVEDSQNDWFRSKQRTTDGTYAAEVDGSANNATLSVATPIDLTGYDSAELTFDWLIEGGFDSGEYLALDVCNGSTWVNDVRRLNGNNSTENVWHHETVDLTPYLSASLQIRFRSKASASDEDANVDNVRITAIAAGPKELPIANAGGSYTVSEGGSNSLDGSGSIDPDGTIASYEWDFDGDSQYDDATGVAPSYSNTQDSEYLVALRFTDNRGAVRLDMVTVTVTNVRPTASAGGPYAEYVDRSVTLNASSSTDPGNDIAR